jgi:hypothetical protein
MCSGGGGQDIEMPDPIHTGMTPPPAPTAEKIKVGKRKKNMSTAGIGSLTIARPTNY